MGKKEVVRYLLQKNASLHQKNENGENALMKGKNFS